MFGVEFNFSDIKMNKKKEILAIKIRFDDNKGNKKLTDEISRLTKLDENNIKKLNLANKEIEALKAKVKEVTEENNKKKKDLYGE